MFKRVSIIVVALILSCALTQVQAQSDRFVYFQSNNGSPFYLRMNGQLYSSTVSGYLILSKIKPGDYQFSVGFPRNEFPEEAFQFSVDNANEGYVITPSASGTVVADIDTKVPLEKISQLNNAVQVQSGAKETSGNGDLQKTKSPSSNTNSFAGMLGDVVSDSSISASPKENIPTPDQAGVVPVRPLAPGAAPVSTTPGGELTVGQTKDTTASQKSVVKLFSEHSADGDEMVYLDKNNSDTVRILMPSAINESAVQNVVSDISDIKKEEQAVATASDNMNPSSSPVSKEPVKKVQSDQVKAEPAKNAEPRIPVEKRDVVSTPATSIPSADQPQNTEDVLPKPQSACTIPADQEDFLKLRKAIAGDDNMNVMIDVVKKAYNERCFTTEQTKNLAYMFLSDEGRYRFLDAVYGLVSDPVNFSSLVNTMTDPYYVRRFKVMIR